jgi:uncharacterized protein YuzE
MKLRIDKEEDALYLKLDDSVVVESEEVKEGVIFDYNEGGSLVGIEILSISKRSPQSLKQILVET